METSVSERDHKVGLTYALAAFGFWGLVPVFFKALQHVPSTELVLHRIIWSVPVTALIIWWGGGWRSLSRAVSNRRVLATLFLTALLITGNFYLFIYAINSGHVLQASLGYFINPLVNVMLGMIFLREKLRRWQGAAVVLAAIGTLNLAVNYGTVPWVSLSLACLFGFYGLLRKTVAIDSVGGFFVETSLVTPIAIAWLIMSAMDGKSSFGATDLWTDILLILAGPVTAVPMLWFTSAARRLPLATVGLCQYVAPSLQFLLAVLYYREPFTTVHLVTFVCIWTALAIYMADMIRVQRKHDRLLRTT